MDPKGLRHYMDLINQLIDIAISCHEARFKNSIISLYIKILRNRHVRIFLNFNYLPLY